MPNLEFPMQDRQLPQWCWAAVAVSIAVFYKTDSEWTQCKLAEAALRIKTCCQNPAPGECNKPWFLHTALGMVSHFKGFTDQPAAFNVLQKEVENGRPVCVRIGWKGSSNGHFVVVDGYDQAAQMVVVRDPDPTVRTTVVNYATLVKGYQGIGHWTHTIFTKTQP